MIALLGRQLLTASLANTKGWHPPLLLRHLTVADFTCTGAQVRATLEESCIALRQYFVEEMCAPDAVFTLAAAIESLDPTQLEAYKTITEWAQQRFNWEKEEPNKKRVGDRRSQWL